MISCAATTCCGSACGLNEEITAGDSWTAAKRAFQEVPEASVAASADATLVSDQLQTEKTEKLELQGESPVEESATKFEEAALPAETALIASKPISVQVTCSRESTLGMTLDMFDEDLCLVKFLKSEGLVPSYNEACPKGQDVQAFYRLVSVNFNRAGTKEMVKSVLNSIASSACLNMDFQPPVQFCAAINTQSGQLKLGLEAYRTKREYLAPLAFESEGALQDYNTTVDSTRQITKLSRIIAVNGERMTGDEILEKMNNLQAFSLTVLNWLD